VLRSDAGETVIEGPLGTLVATGGADPPSPTGERIWVSLRPECLRLVPAGSAAATRNRFSGRLTATSYLGEIAEHRVEVGTQIVSVFELNPRPEPAPDGAREVAVEVDPADVVVLPFDDERLGQPRDPSPPTATVSG
jgi:ABC-type Fe3+/spermidine/putrescine transport system ATPase subunit